MVTTESIIEYIRVNPDATYKIIAAHLGVSDAQVGKAAQTGRKRGLLPVRYGNARVVPTPRPPPVAVPVAPAPVVTVVAPPAPPPSTVLPTDLAGLAREAVRARLIRLADPNLISQEGSRDLRETVKLLVDTHPLLTSFEASKGEDGEDEPTSLLDQLRIARKTA